MKPMSKRSWDSDTYDINIDRYHIYIYIHVLEYVIVFFRTNKCIYIFQKHASYIILKSSIIATFNIPGPVSHFGRCHHLEGYARGTAHCAGSMP